MTLYALRIDGQLRGVFTDEARCYDIVNRYEKAGQYDWQITPIEANRLCEEPVEL